MSVQPYLLSPCIDAVEFEVTTKSWAHESVLQLESEVLGLGNVFQNTYFSDVEKMFTSPLPKQNLPSLYNLLFLWKVAIYCEFLELCMRLLFRMLRYH
jgi:hypothetical protein